MEFFFEPQNFISSLKFMGIGMLAILIVVGIIVCVTYLLNYFTSNKAKKSSKILAVCATMALLIAVSLFNLL